MASYGRPRLLEGMKAGANLATADFHRAGKQDANGDIIRAGAGEGSGFIMSESESGQAVEFAVQGGDALAKSAGTHAPGDFVKSDANGDMVASIKADTLARALEPAVSGDVFRVQVIG